MTFTPPLMIEMLKHNLHWITSAQIKTITEQWDNHPLSEQQRYYWNAVRSGPDGMLVWYPSVPILAEVVSAFDSHHSIYKKCSL